MKNILLIWNIVLTALVAYLFFSNSAANSGTVVTNEDTLKTEIELPKATAQTGNVFYVNTDSLFSGFKMYEDMQEELVTEQLKMKKRYDNQLGQLETEYNDLRERAPYMTQTQGEAAQKKLMAKQQDLVKMEEKLTSKLAKKEADMVKKIKASLSAYLAEIQNEKGFQFVLGKSEIGGVLFASEELDLTTEVLEGLNRKYQEANLKTEEK